MIGSAHIKLYNPKLVWTHRYISSNEKPCNEESKTISQNVMWKFVTINIVACIYWFKGSNYQTTYQLFITTRFHIASYS